MPIQYDIVHTTVYRYRQPVRFGEHRVMFRPRDSHDLRLLHTLDVPVFLINRDDDKVAPVDEMGDLARLLPRCYGYEVLNDGGRFVTYTWADRVNELLRGFLGKLAAGEPPPLAVEAPR